MYNKVAAILLGW